jgi:hypothetical protein
MERKNMGSNANEAEHTARLLDARMDGLEKQVAFLLRVNGLDLSHFRTVKDDELLGLYQDAVQLVAVVPKGMALEVIERWAEFFIQLSEYEFTRLQPIVSFDHTWEPFFLLCTKMMTQVRHDPKLPDSLRIQQLYALLDKGRKNLRDAAVIMCRKYPGTLTKRGMVMIKDGDLLASIS